MNSVQYDRVSSRSMTSSDFEKKKRTTPKENSRLTSSTANVSSSYILQPQLEYPEGRKCNRVVRAQGSYSKGEPPGGGRLQNDSSVMSQLALHRKDHSTACLLLRLRSSGSRELKAVKRGMIEHSAPQSGVWRGQLTSQCMLHRNQDSAGHRASNCPA
jgi:hypothetical protein